MGLPQRDGSVRTALLLLAFIPSQLLRRNFPKLSSPRVRESSSGKAELHACRTASEAVNLLHSTAISFQDRSCRRLDARGYMFMVITLIGLPVSIILTLILVMDGASAWWMLSPFLAFSFPALYGASCWARSEYCEDPEPDLRAAITYHGGLGELPASIWAEPNEYLFHRYPLLLPLRHQYLSTIQLTPVGIEIFDQLVADGFAGTLDDLASASQLLAQS